MFVARDVRIGGLRLGHSTVEAGEQRGVATCAVERRFLLAGANPAQQLSTCRQPDYAAFAAQGFECPGFFAGIIGIITVISGSPTGCRPA